MDPLKRFRTRAPETMAPLNHVHVQCDYTVSHRDEYSTKLVCSYIATYAKDVHGIELSLDYIAEHLEWGVEDYGAVRVHYDRYLYKPDPNYSTACYEGDTTMARSSFNPKVLKINDIPVGWAYIDEGSPVSCPRIRELLVHEDNVADPGVTFGVTDHDPSLPAEPTAHGFYKFAGDGSDHAGVMFLKQPHAWTIIYTNGVRAASSWDELVRRYGDKFSLVRV